MYLYIHFLVFIKVADWTSALLDAHFTQFLLSYEARELLFELADAVKYQVSKRSNAAFFTYITSFAKYFTLMKKLILYNMAVDVKGQHFIMSINQ